MGLLGNLMGNASKIDLKSIEKEYDCILFPGEQLEAAYHVFRDKWVFTDKRLIIQNVQGLTGKKREYHSIPYQSITRFSVETAGTFDMECEMKIWVKGSDTPIEQTFGTKVDVKSIQQALAYHVMG